MVDGAVVWMTHRSLFWWRPSPSHTQVPMPGKVVWFVDWQCCWPETTQKSSPQSAGSGSGGGGDGGEGGEGGGDGGGGSLGGGGGLRTRGPQSVQSVPRLQSELSAPGPPSSHQSSEA